jgi:hypothetical protein
VQTSGGTPPRDPNSTNDVPFSAVYVSLVHGR